MMIWENFLYMVFINTMQVVTEPLVCNIWIMVIHWLLVTIIHIIIIYIYTFVHILYILYAYLYIPCYASSNFTYNIQIFIELHLSILMCIQMDNVLFSTLSKPNNNVMTMWIVVLLNLYFYHCADVRSTHSTYFQCIVLPTFGFYASHFLQLPWTWDLPMELFKHLRVCYYTELSAIKVELE